MSTIIVELYDALRSVGVDEDKAKAAAAAVIGGAARNDLATKTDLAILKTDLMEQMGVMESRLYRTIITGIIAMTTAIIAMTAVFAAIVKLL